MGYMHIKNLYKDDRIFLFKECYALEKIHGTSAHIAWLDGNIHLFSGGARYKHLAAVLDFIKLAEGFKSLGYDNITVFGEACGGKMQAMKHVYGDKLRFIPFEVRIGETWLSVPDAEDVCKKLGLGFVPYNQIPVTLEDIDRERDNPSFIAQDLGLGVQAREGVVLKPLLECSTNQGRVIVKHKSEAHRETRTKRKVGKPLEVTKEMEAAKEWVTKERLRHVVDHLAAEDPSIAAKPDISDTQTIITAMIEDVLREGEGEIEDSRATRKAISRQTVILWKEYVHENASVEGKV